MVARCQKLREPTLKYDSLIPIYDMVFFCIASAVVLLLLLFYILNLCVCIILFYFYNCIFILFNFSIFVAKI